MQHRLRFLTSAVATAGVVLASITVPMFAEGATKRSAKSGAKPTATRSRSAASTSVAAKGTARKATAKRTRYSSSRRARAARLRAARYAREVRELANPLYRVDDSGAMVPDVRAAAAIIYDPVTQQVLWEENADATRSIASITKVMTALVALDHEVDLTREVKVEPQAVRGARHTYLRANETIRLDDLLNLMLVASDNAAARQIARSSTVGYDGFIQLMNDKAVELGLDHTHYADPSGLDPGNVASARDMARLIAFVSNDERISSIMRKTEYRASTSRRQVVVHNTNRLLGSDVQVQGGKTGFIRDAGYCLATLLRLPQGEPIAVVVLGARSSAGRFMETRHLFNWISGQASRLIGTAVPAALPAPIPQAQQQQ
jgi:D-alanyl-D-alanine endopeptidase (penicillin-binding protein 7)